MSRFLCNYPDCGKAYANRAGLSRHKANKHKPRTRTVIAARTCTLCDHVFASDQHLKIHNQNYHQNSGRNRTIYFCLSCHKEFNTKQLLSSHLKNTHNTNTKTCCHCHKRYKFKHTCSVNRTIYDKIYSVDEYHILEIKNELYCLCDERNPTIQDVKRAIIKVCSKYIDGNTYYSDIVQQLQRHENHDHAVKSFANSSEINLRTRCETQFQYLPPPLETDLQILNNSTNDDQIADRLDSRYHTILQSNLVIPTTSKPQENRKRKRVKG